jgi:methionine-rich copper-binding protein CopC
VRRSRIPNSSPPSHPPEKLRRPPVRSASCSTKATVDPSNKKMMIVPLKDQLAPGDYKVQWYAVSDDTHKVKGSYSFGVAQ